MSDEKITEFVTITGASEEVAKSLLNVCNGNLEMAINMQMEGVQTHDPQDLQSRPGPSSGVAAASAGYSGTEDLDEDGVRAPIPQKQEVLVQPGYEGYSLNRNSSMLRQSRVRSVFDGFRNFSNESKSYENGTGKKGSKKRTLDELFKPPLDLMFKGDFQTARDAASGTKKWLMVNVQDACEFQCQVLNRDVWSSEAVKTIIREHFIFWQQYKESEDAQRYTTFYPVNEWPYIAILDPRTGELLVAWQKVKDASTFCDLVSEFLTVHPSMDPNGSAKDEDSEDNKHDDEPPGKRPKSILDADEDDQIAMAIQASLKEAEKKKKNAPEHGDDNDEDDDFDDEEDYFESFSAENSNSCSQPAKHIAKTETKKIDDWEQYLGNEEDPNSSIMIRFPNGTRVTKEIPCSSQFLAIIGFVKKEGFSSDQYEIVTNFPRKILTDLDPKQTLKELGLFPKETVFVQQK